MISELFIHQQTGHLEPTQLRARGFDVPDLEVIERQVVSEGDEASPPSA